MPRDRNIILGISPGTRSFGIAVIQNGILVDWGVRAFNDKWSADKLQRILSRLDTVIRINEVDFVACKTVHPSRSSKELNELLAAIMEYCNKSGLERMYLTLQEIGTGLISEEKVTKRVIVDHLLLKYPEIIPYFKKEKRNKRPYYIKVFEALAAADYAMTKKSP